MNEAKLSCLAFPFRVIFSSAIYLTAQYCWPKHRRITLFRLGTLFASYLLVDDSSWL